MKQTNLLFTAIVVAILALGGSVKAQMTAQEAVVKMGRGINLGNTLDASNYEGEWAPAAKESFFEMYAQAGFQTVRVPITWNKRLGTEAPYKIDSVFLNRVDTIIEWCLERNLNVIINVHHDSWLKNHETFDEQKPRFYALWEQLSVHYKDYPESLIFEILNEPHYEDNNNVSKSLTQAQVDEANKRGLEIIREHNPTRIAIYGGKQWSGSWDLTAAAIPDSSDKYLMGYYHSYDPFEFAHEAKGTWGTESDKKEMVDQMLRVQEWSQENNIPVLIGEFGARVECDYNSRALWYEHYASSAIALGFAFAVWDDNGWFQVLERETETWGDVMDIIIHSSDSSITNVGLEIIEDTVVQVSWQPRSDSSLINKVLVERRTLETDFAVVAEFAGVSSTTVPTKYLDYDTEIGEYAYYRLLEVYSNDTIPSYPQRIYRLPTERNPYDGVINIPGTVEAENFDEGGQLLTYYDMEPENRGGAYRLDEGVDIESRPDGGYQVGYVVEGEWMEYTVNVAKQTEYQFTAYVASEQADGKFQLKFGTNKFSSLITTPSTNSWTTLTTVTGKIKLDAGEQIMRFMIKGENPFNIDKIEFEEATSVEDQPAQINIYPNPASKAIIVALNGAYVNTIEIYNSKGQLMVTKQTDVADTQVNVEHLTNGLYFVIAKTDNDVIKQSFVKQ